MYAIITLSEEAPQKLVEEVLCHDYT